MGTLLLTVLPFAVTCTIAAWTPDSDPAQPAKSRSQRTKFQPQPTKFWPRPNKFQAQPDFAPCCGHQG
jgi:hypothetical protein